MATHLWARRSAYRFHAALMYLALAAFLFAPPAAPAAELADSAHSLQMVPADAAFYSASLRLQEQFDILLQSKAVARLMEIPLIQLVKMQAVFRWQQSPDETIANLREYVQSPEGQEAVAVLKEMFSDEVFVYGGNDIASALRLLMRLNGVQRTARLEAATSGEEFETVMADQVRELLEENKDDFKIPTMVFGFRVEDADRARRQLDEVHALVRNLLDENQPELSAHLQRDQIAGYEFLTLRLDGSMIPWNKIREEADNIDEEQFNEWRDMLNSKTLAVALGVVDQFVLLSIGASTYHLETIGQGTFLADQPAIKRLARHADQRVASIAYLSEPLAKSLNSPQQTIEDLAGTADEMLRQAEVDDEHRAQLVEDIRSLNISKYMPQQGEISSIAYLTERGYEAFQYSTGTKPMSDSSKPLTIRNHVGGNPMFFVASRSNDTVEDYDEAIDWLRRAAKNIEQIIESKADPEDLAKYQQYRDRILGLLRRVNRANREQLYPAFADNQGALVVDVAATSNRWIRHMPAARKPLPMIEFGIVASVSDDERLREGAKEYFAILRDAVELVREMNPEDTPEFTLQQPQRRELDAGGTLYVYPLPAEWGLDEKVAPNAGLTQTAAALSTITTTTERLLRATPLEIDSSLELDRPAAQIMYADFRKMIDAIRPWVDYGLDVAMGNLKTEEDEDDSPEQSPMMMQMGFVAPQIHQLLDVASAVRSVSSITYREDDLWVKHSETHFQDLK